MSSRDKPPEILRRLRVHSLLFEKPSLTPDSEDLPTYEDGIEVQKLLDPHNEYSGGVTEFHITETPSKNNSAEPEINSIRKRHRYEGQSVSVNSCSACKCIIKCPYEIKKSQWKPLCVDCAYKGVG